MVEVTVTAMNCPHCFEMIQIPDDVTVTLMLDENAPSIKCFPTEDSDGL